MGGHVDLDEDVMESRVDEISIDDFMDVLIDALNTDADVFESDRQITTDPWFGRQDIGLGPVGVKLDDPLDIFDDIYGNLNFGQNSKNLLTSPYMSANDYTTSLYGTPQLAGQFPRTPFGAFGTGFNMSPNPLNPADGYDGHDEHDGHVAHELHPADADAAAEPVAGDGDAAGDGVAAESAGPGVAGDADAAAGEPVPPWLGPTPAAAGGVSPWLGPTPATA